MLCSDFETVKQVLGRNGVRTSNSDVIRVLCHSCQKEEVCPCGGVMSTKKDGLGGQPMVEMPAKRR